MNEPLMQAKSIEKAQKLVERYNRETEQIAAVEDRLYRLNGKHRRTRDAAFAALPKNAGITMSTSEPWAIQTWEA
jgi:hypothetical protein